MIVPGAGVTTLTSGFEPGAMAATTRWAPARIAARCVARSDPVSAATSEGEQRRLMTVVAVAYAASTMLCCEGPQVAPQGMSVLISFLPALAACTASAAAQVASSPERGPGSRSKTASVAWRPSPTAEPARRMAKAPLEAKPSAAAVAGSQTFWTAMRARESFNCTRASRSAVEQPPPVAMPFEHELNCFATER